MLLFDDDVDDDDLPIVPEHLRTANCLVVGPRAASSDELNVREWCYRNAPPGSHLIVFAEIDEQTGAEQWEETITVDRDTDIATSRWIDAEPFQKAMGLSRRPTIQEAQDFQRKAKAKAGSDLQEALQPGSAASRAVKAAPI
jgi:hypothetical protein